MTSWKFNLGFLSKVLWKILKPGGISSTSDDKEDPDNDAAQPSPIPASRTTYNVKMAAINAAYNVEIAAVEAASKAKLGARI